MDMKAIVQGDVPDSAAAKESRKRWEAQLKIIAARHKAALEADGECQKAEAMELLGKRLSNILWGPYDDDGGIQITELVFEDGSRLKLKALSSWGDYEWIEAEIIPPEE